jgi:hypothetical protein
MVRNTEKPWEYTVGDIRSMATLKKRTTLPVIAYFALTATVLWASWGIAHTRHQNALQKHWTG